MTARTRAALPFASAFALLATPLAAQAGDALPTLRELPEGTNPQRHLLQTFYEQVKFPKVAQEARRGGAYLLTINIDAAGASTWEAVPLTASVKPANPINLVVVAADETAGATVSGQMKVNADRALIEETERMGRYLVDIGFTPAVRQGTPVADSLQLAIYYRME